VDEYAPGGNRMVAAEHRRAIRPNNTAITRPELPVMFPLSD
jgi:hypothetical protein